jgi:hypothetical protein
MVKTPFYSLVPLIVTALLAQSAIAFDFDELFSLPTYLPIECQRANTGKMNYIRLKRIVEDCKVTSVEQLLPLLPQEYRSRYTLVYGSRSLQFASPEHPRVISFGLTGELVMAFSGDPDEKGFDSLETMEFERPEKKFKFRSIDFSSGSKPIFSKTNPQKCLDCHRSPDPRPNWDGYFLWPGVFGAEDQGMFGGDAEDDPTKFPNEKALFARYLAHRHEGRYQFLDDFKNFRESGSNPEPYFPNGRIDYFARCDHNLGLTQMIGGLNGERLAKRIADDRKTDPYRYAILAALSCGAEGFTPQQQDIESYLPESVKKGFAQGYSSVNTELATLNRKNYVDRILRHFSLTGLISPEDPRIADTYNASSGESLDSDQGVSEAGAIAYLMRGLAMDMTDWSMEFVPDGSTHYSMFIARGRVGAIEEFYWKEVLDPVKDRELVELYERAVKGGFLGFFLDWGDDNASKPRPMRDQLCTALRAKSLGALGPQ